MRRHESGQSEGELFRERKGKRLVVLKLGDLEGEKRGQHGAADPDAVLALRRGHDLDLHEDKGERLISFAMWAQREHDVAVQVLADVHIAQENLRQKDEQHEESPFI